MSIPNRPKEPQMVEVAVDDRVPQPLQEGKPMRMPVAGLPLPPGFVNMPLGAPGHRCLDPEGIYRPDWSCVFIHRTAEVPTRQSFLSHSGDTLLVPTNDWVDVPPEVVEVLRDTKVAKIVREGLAGEGLSKAMKELEVGSTPRWQFNVVPSG